MERPIANIEIAQQYLQQINDRLLVADEPYDADSKSYNVGTFYIYRGMGQKGVEYSIREVTSETGAYKVHGGEGMLSDQVCFYLQGFLQGHFETCVLLGYELIENENNAEGAKETETTDEDVSVDDEKAEG